MPSKPPHKSARRKPAGAKPARPTAGKALPSNVAATQMLDADEARRVARGGPVGDDEAATQFAEPGVVDEVRSQLAARARPTLPEIGDNDATILGDPGFMAEVRAQLAAEAEAQSADPDAGAFEPESGQFELAPEDLDEGTFAAQPPGAADDPVIAALLEADSTVDQPAFNSAEDDVFGDMPHTLPQQAPAEDSGSTVMVDAPEELAHMAAERTSGAEPPPKPALVRAEGGARVRRLPPIEPDANPPSGQYPYAAQDQVSEDAGLAFDDGEEPLEEGPSLSSFPPPPELLEDEELPEFLDPDDDAPDIPAALVPSADPPPAANDPDSGDLPVPDLADGPAGDDMALDDGVDAPSDDAPSDDAPADDAPSDDAPSDDIPSDDIPSDDAPSDGAPSDDAPLGDVAAASPSEAAADGPAVLTPGPVKPPVRTHRVGDGGGKLLLAVPSVADVLVDGQAAGTGSVLLLGMAPQVRLAVEVSTPGYDPWRSLVSLGGRNTGQVKVELKRSPA